MNDLGAARCVAIVAAMVPELEPLIRALRLVRAPRGGPRALAGRLAAREVVATVTTMGTAAARSATRALLEAYRVDHLLVVGICGAIDHRLARGELVTPAVVVDEASGTEYHPSALGRRPSAGALLTSDVLHNDPTEVAALARAGFVAVDMETAAIGAESEARGIPWSVFRSVSDRAGDPGVDAALIAMSHPDGTPNPRAILRFLLTRPDRIPKLVQLGAGMRAAVRSSSAAALAALGAPDEQSRGRWASVRK